MIYFSSENEFCESLNKYSLPVYVKELIQANASDFFYLIPKIVFSWYLYALEKVIYERSESGAKISKIIDSKRLPLFNLKNSDYEVSEESREDLLRFIDQINVKSDDQNASLNLLNFNNETSLFTLYLILIESFYSIQRYKNSEKISNEDKEASKELHLLFSDYAKYINYKGIATQSYLIGNKRYLNSKGKDFGYIVEYNQFFNKIKDIIRFKILSELEINSSIDLPEEIKDDVLIYKLLCNEELYEELIFDLNIVDFKSISRLEYKCCYEALYNEKKKQKNDEHRKQNKHSTDLSGNEINNKELIFHYFDGVKSSVD